MGQKIIPGTNQKVQNIFCIGRNYTEHIKELNNSIPTRPVVFIKPTSSICYDGGSLILPKQSIHVDHEVEIVILIGISGKNIPESNALDYISHVGIGIDFTARDLQDQAKEKSLPWSVAKGFDTFAAISSFVPFNGSASDLNNLSFQLEINGEIRQKGNSKNMIFSIPAIVSYLSSIFTLTEGDLIFTGTPEGVGIVREGEIIKASMTNGPTLSLDVKVEY